MITHRCWRMGGLIVSPEEPPAYRGPWAYQCPLAAMGRGYHR
jgi:hypothetical protein